IRPGSTACAAPTASPLPCRSRRHDARAPMPMDRSMTPRPARLTLVLPLLLAACAGGGTRDAVPEPVAVGHDPAAEMAAPAHAHVPAEAPMQAQAADAQGLPADGTGPAPDVATGTQDDIDASATDTADPAAGPTQAELDYAAIYGPAPYDPVADPTLPQP